MKKIFLVLVFLNVLVSSAGAPAQEEKDTPSDKMKGALEKIKKAPAAIGKGLTDLKEAAKAKIQETLGTAPAPAPTQEPDALALPEKKPAEPGAPRYSPEGKRDPFQPLALRQKPKRPARESLSPLERYELGQLKLVGIVWDVKEPRAMVEDAAGLGYIVKVGTPIGPNDGKVKQIKPNEVVIEEQYVDFYGARKVRQVSMKLVAG